MKLNRKTYRKAIQRAKDRESLALDTVWFDWDKASRWSRRFRTRVLLEFRYSDKYKRRI